MKPTGPTNPVLKDLINELRTQGYKDNIKFMINLAKRLETARRRRAEVNISKLERVCKKDETVVVPGKVLSSGILTKPLTVAALNFSTQAKEKIKKAGGNAITIKELIKKNPKGTNVRLMI